MARAKVKEEVVPVTKQELIDLENQLAQRRREYERQREVSRREVTEKLAIISDEITAKVREAQALASTVDLVFQWHDGYDEFVTAAYEEWNSSSYHC